MKSKYQNYYDKLNGKNFTSLASNYQGYVEDSSTKLNEVKSLINSSSWVEKGLEIVKNSVIPSLESQTEQVKEGIKVLQEASAKINDLVSRLGELDSFEKKLDSLGGTWSTSSGKTEEEVNRHNSEINNLKNEITSKEGEIDGIVSSINSLSYTFNSLSSSGFSSIMLNLKEAVKEPESGVLDMTPGKEGTGAEEGRNARLLGKAAVILDFTCDGEHLGQDGEIVIKKDQTVHLKVRIPDDVEGVEQISRTSADGQHDSEGRPLWANWVSQQVTPKANKKDNTTWFNGREYDWYITGKNTTGNDFIKLSQTVLFKAPNTAAANKQASYKGMARLRVKVVD